MKHVHLPEGSEESAGNGLERALSLSFKISRFSPPMKPFIRFSPATDGLYQTADIKNRSLFWDFDDTLQRILLNIVKAISTPSQLTHACIERWKINLEELYERNQIKLKEVSTGKRPYQFRESVISRFISKRLNGQSHFLHTGCGSGKEALNLAKLGHDVIGIDTIFPLTQIANAWARQLALPFQAICMDFMDLGFVKKAFDSFLLAYGYQPGLNQSLLLQKNMARLLRKGGQGYIVGHSKNYASFWFLMGKIYPTSMSSWLAKQAVLDHRWGKNGGHEEKLMYGLYLTTHTVESLSKELGYAFQIKECLYAKDPRYIICVVEPKDNLDSLPDLEDSPEWNGNGSDYLKLDVDSIDGILDQIEAIGNFLESHERNMLQYFEDEAPEGKGPLQGLPLDLTGFLGLLKAVFSSLPDFMHSDIK